MGTWQVQTAKSRLSEVIDDAQTKGPQIITRHGAERAVVLSIEDYRNLSEEKPAKPAQNFVEFLLSGPQFDDPDIFDVRREVDPEREIDL